MKVSSSLGFKPITVVLETEAEAKWIWACLKSASKLARELSCIDLSSVPVSLTIEMWQKLNSVYCPMMKDEEE